MLPLASRNVLVCLRYGIGDVVMELPALSALRSALPEARITGIATAPAHELLDGDPRVDRVVLTSRWALRHRWDGGDPETRSRIAAWVRAQEFDLVLDARYATLAVSSAIWSLGIRSLESDEGEERAAIVRGESGIEAIRAAVRAGWGLEVSGRTPPQLRLRAGDRAFAEAFLEEHGLGGATPFAISPVASHDLKRWPVERFAAVADHVVERGAGPVLVLEGPQAEEGRRVVAAMRNAGAAIRVGPHHLLRTAALLERCRGFACNDTGLMHVASAAGVRTIGVFGPTRGQIYLPPRPNTTAAEPHALDCGHRATDSLYPPKCWRAGHCLIAGHSCVRRTRTADVLAAVDRILDGLPDGRAAADRRNGRPRMRPRPPVRTDKRPAEERPTAGASA